MINGKKLGIFQSCLACSGLEAKALHQKGKAFAAELIKLCGLYSVEIYNQSWDIERELENFPEEPTGRLQKFKHKAALAKLKSKIGGDLKAMWETAIAARRVEQELFYALDVYELQVTPESFITTLLETLNEVGEIRDPVLVANGREIYENIVFKRDLIQALGLQPDICDMIESRFYYTYERKR